MLAVLALGWATLQGGRFLLPPLLPRITETLGFSPGAIGIALTAFGLIYALVQYPSGTYSDELSRGTLVLPGFAVLLVAFAVIGGSVTAGLFVCGLVVLGVGKGLYASPSRALVNDLFDARRGRALGVYSAGTDLGGLVAAGLAVAVLATTTWRMAFVPIFAILTGVTVLFAVWNREAYRLARVRLDPAGTAGRIVATREQRELVVAFAIFYFFVGGLTNFFPTLLVTAGFSETVAGASFALLFAVGLVTKPVAGEMTDRFSRTGVSIAGLLVAIVGVVLVLTAPTLPVVAVGTVLTALGYKTQFPIADAVIMDAAPAGNVGGDLGAARAVFLGANALGPGAVGLIAEFSSFAVAFWMLAASLLVCVVIITRQHVRD
jgi:MFS family permease